MKIIAIAAGFIFTFLTALTNIGYGAIYSPVENNNDYYPEYEKCHLVKASMINGKFIPVVDLPEIEISVEKEELQMINKDSNIDEGMGIVNLPVVEIVEYFKYHNPHISFHFLHGYTFQANCINSELDLFLNHVKSNTLFQINKI